jgi:hypothetical protein
MPKSQGTVLVVGGYNQLFVGIWQSPQLGRTPLLLLRCCESWKNGSSGCSAKV